MQSERNVNKYMASAVVADSSVILQNTYQLSNDEDDNLDFTLRIGDSSPKVAIWMGFIFQKPS